MVQPNIQLLGQELCNGRDDHLYLLKFHERFDLTYTDNFSGRIIIYGLGF
jgi:hypothetical protein